MQFESAGNNDRPATHTLMAAVIRLMAQCAGSGDEAPIRTLLTLLRQLRDHPDLPRQPAVLGSLATAHAIWVDRLSTVCAATVHKGGFSDGEGNPQRH